MSAERKSLEELQKNVGGADHQEAELLHARVNELVNYDPHQVVLDISQQIKAEVDKQYVTCTEILGRTIWAPSRK